MGLLRAQILLEEDQQRRLAHRAYETGRSMSELVREAVSEYLSRESETEAVRRSLVTLQRLEAIRQQVMLQNGALPDEFLDEMRTERDQELAP